MNVFPARGEWQPETPIQVKSSREFRPRVKTDEYGCTPGDWKRAQANATSAQRERDVRLSLGIL